MQFRSIADLSCTLHSGLHLVLDDVDLIVGIPRGGMLPASLHLQPTMATEATMLKRSTRTTRLGPVRTAQQSVGTLLGRSNRCRHDKPCNYGHKSSG